MRYSLRLGPKRTSMPILITEGWSDHNGKARQFHYFRNGMSLCGRWKTQPSEVKAGRPPYRGSVCTRCRLRNLLETIPIDNE
jgi:hypothetical protein